MPRKRRVFNGKSAVVANILLSSIGGFAVILLCILVFAFIISKIDVNDSIVTVLSCVALCVGAYAGGYFAAKKRRKNGLLMGVICSLFMFFVILMISMFFIRTIAGFSPSLKLLLTIVCGAVGGIVGVNSKNSRFS
ncbi:MAG: TIGR04086 family membrane protein [Ruminococcus sp.]|nr:TIGR04086 family membrane protein [Ruminococcus sp.]